MPRIPDKIDDWTPPWSEGEFDAEKAKTLVFNALRAEQKAKDERRTLAAEKAELETKLGEAEQQLAAKPEKESAKDAEISELRSRIQKLEKDGRPEDQGKIDRLELALEKGLTLSQSRRLVGSTREELEEDAEVLIADLGLDQKKDDSPASQPPRRQPDPSGGARSLGNGRDRKSGDDDRILSVEELRDQKRKDEAGGLVPLTR